jgi:predicted transcriptional regulator
MGTKEHDEMTGTSEVWSLRLPAEAREKIDEIAGKLDRSRHWLLKSIIEDYLKHYAAEEALIRERLALSERPDAEFIPHDEAMAEIEAILNAKSQ